jgi:MYXO-CTERM domain-containing protein
MAAAAQTYLGTAGVADPRNNTFDFVLVGNGLVDALLAADLASDGGADSLYNTSKELTARRWADAIVFISSLLWSAWNDAGRPELAGFSSTCSRAAPVGDPVVNGFPPPGGFTHDTDGGTWDAGVDDAGTSGGGDGATGGGSGSTGGGSWTYGGGFGSTGGGGDVVPEGCSCTGSPGALFALMGVVTLLRRRR